MIRGFNHVGLSVSDLEQSLRFYGDLLGLETRFLGEFGGPHYERVLGIANAKGRVAVMELGSLRLELFEFSTPNPRPAAIDRPVSDVGLTHFCVEVSDIDAVYLRLAQGGVSFHCPPTDFDGAAKATYGRDPDGNVFELWERGPGAAL